MAVPACFRFAILCPDAGTANAGTADAETMALALMLIRYYWLSECRCQLQITQASNGPTQLHVLLLHYRVQMVNQSCDFAWFPTFQSTYNMSFLLTVVLC